MTRPVSTDALSLTLPARSTTRARRRKWKRPPFMFWWWLALTVWAIFETTHLLVDGDLPWAALNGACAMVDWKIAQRVYRRRPFPDLALVCVAMVIPMFGLIIAGVQ